MINRYAIIFLILSTLFAAVHYVAVMGSLYWYYWWFDEVMHFSGGLLIGLGVHALAGFKSLPVRPTLKTVLTFLFLATITWEIFEWHYGITGTQNYAFDTAKDIFLGFSGGLLAHAGLRAYTMK